jgi:hypothetical protein
MSDAPAGPVKPRIDPLAPGIRLYTIVCMVSAIGVAIPLMVRGMDSAALLPAVVGVLVALLRWRVGALLFLISIIWLVWADRVGLGPVDLLAQLPVRLVYALTEVYRSGLLYGLGFFDNPRPKLGRPNLMLDVWLVGTILVFIASYYRLLGLTRSIFPIDSLRRGPSRKTASGEPKRGRILTSRRSAALVDASELGKLVPAGVTATVLAQYLLRWLQKRNSSTDLASHVPLGLQVQLRDNIWQVVLLLGLFVFSLTVLSSLLGYMGLRRQTPEEAALYLQDTLWRQTRREQARLNRWRAWAEKLEARRLASARR